MINTFMMSHRLRKREDCTRNFGSFILRPILAQFTTLNVVHFPGTYLMTQSTNFDNLYGFFVQCNKHSNFCCKINFPKGIIKKYHFFMRICHTKAQSTSYFLQWL
jgi:hypothetical protein